VRAQKEMVNTKGQTQEMQMPLITWAVWLGFRSRCWCGHNRF